MVNSELAATGYGSRKAGVSRARKTTDPAAIKDIKHAFLERFNTLADKSFSTVPFDEDMWNYLHELQEEILDIYARLRARRGLFEWNDQAGVNIFCESVHVKLSECEERLGL